MKIREFIGYHREIGGYSLERKEEVLKILKARARPDILMERHDAPAYVAMMRVHDQLERMYGMRDKYDEFAEKLKEHEHDAVRPDDWSLWIQFMLDYSRRMSGIHHGRDLRDDMETITADGYVRKIRDTMKQNVREQ